MPQQPLFVVLLLLSAAVATVAVAKRLRLPSLLAYLAIGMTLGPHGLKVLAESQAVENLAEFGVVFLMFSIGLEFSLQKLFAMAGLVFGFGGAQMLLTALGTALATWYGYGQGWESGIAVGLAVGMSSTAIVARLLSERFELHSRSGRQTMGVLLFQDLAVVPCLIVFPALSRHQDDLPLAMAAAALQTAVVLGLLVGLGRRPMKAILDMVAKRRSAELFVLTTLWIVLALGTATHAVGLSLALGAFIGGMLISETIYRHQVEADIRPFRDLFLALFFVTVGMMLDLTYVVTHLHLLALAVALLVAGKGGVVLLLALLRRAPMDVALRSAAQLAQAGEFGLVLIQLARDLNLVAEEVFQVTLSAMLISMFIAPFLIERAARWSGQLSRGDWAHRAKAVHDIATTAFSLENHVIICGYGRTGRHIGEFLQAEGLPFVALDLHPAAMPTDAPHRGPCVFGNAERLEVLKAAGIARARAVVVAFADPNGAARVIQLARSERPGVPVLVRCADDSTVARLKAEGASEVVPEVVEGSLMLAAEVLIHCEVPVHRALGRVRAIRAERYPSLRDYYRELEQGPESRHD